MAKRQSFSPSTRGHELPSSADDLPDLVSVDLDDADGENFVIVEEDDTPEADRGKPTSYEEEESVYDIAAQTDDLRKRRDPASRIKRLGFERETERRRAEQSERERDAAIEAAHIAREEADDLRQRLTRSSSALGENMVERNKQAIEAARGKLTRAHEEGNSEAIADAQIEISRLTAEELAIKSRVPPRGAAPTQQRPAPAAQPAAQPAAAPSLAPQVADWIGRNTWFNKRGQEEKTEMAMGIHRGLIARGIQPSDPRYTQELDRKMKAVYKDHVVSPGMPDDDTGGGPRREAPRPNANGGGSREQAPGATPRTVTLTRSELSIAKRLGVSPQQYALSKVQREKRLGQGDGA